LFLFLAPCLLDHAGAADARLQSMTPAQIRLALALTVLVTLLPLQACKKAAPASGLIPIKFQTDWYPQPEHGGFYTALANGYYKDAGLEVQIVPGGPYVNAEQQVSVGTAQFGMSSSDRILEANANGQPLVAVAATMQHDPQAIMLHAASPVHSFAELNGHAVAIRPGSTWFEYIVKRYGLKDVHERPATYSVANFIQDPEYIQQIFVTSEPFYARRANQPVRTMLISETGYDPYRVFFSSQSYVKEHPEIVAKFVQASLRGWREYLRDPKAAHELIRKLNPAIDPELMQFSYEALRDGHFIDGSNTLGQLDSQRFTTMEQTLVDLKVLSKTVDPASVFTARFLR
jgi:NitT/TauT family transport system substrate-binding protein